MRPFSSVPVGKRNPETQTILSSQAGGAERSKRTAFYPAGEEAWLAEEVAVLEAAKEGGERHQQSDLCGTVYRGAERIRTAVSVRTGWLLDATAQMGEGEAAATSDRKPAKKTPGRRRSEASTRRVRGQA